MSRQRCRRSANVWWRCPVRSTAAAGGPAAGAGVVQRLVGGGDADGRAAVLAKADATGRAVVVAAGVPVHEAARDAVAALGEVPAAVKRPLTVTLRHNG